MNCKAVDCFKHFNVIQIDLLQSNIERSVPSLVYGYVIFTDISQHLRSVFKCLLSHISENFCKIVLPGHAPLSVIVDSHCELDTHHCHWKLTVLEYLQVSLERVSVLANWDQLHMPCLSFPCLGYA